VPQADDDVALAGYVIVWDTSLTRIPATGTLTSITSTGTAGQISLALDNAAFHGGASLYCTTITAGTKPATAGILLITGTTDHVLTLTVGIGVGEGIIGGSDSAQGVRQTGTGTINVIGNISSGTGISSHGFVSVAASTVNVTGDISASGGPTTVGFYNNSTGNVSVVGNITGGSDASNNYNYGLYNGSNASVSVDGIITGGTGSWNSIGLCNASTGNVTLSTSTKLIAGTRGAAYSGKSPAWQPDSTSFAKFYVGASFGQAANTEFPQVLAAANIKAGVTSGSVTGTFMIMLKTFVKILTESGWVNGV
jgi:hypothetical protein